MPFIVIEIISRGERLMLREWWGRTGGDGQRIVGRQHSEAGVGGE